MDLFFIVNEKKIFVLGLIVFFDEICKDFEEFNILVWVVWMFVGIGELF